MLIEQSMQRNGESEMTPNKMEPKEVRKTIDNRQITG